MARSNVVGIISEDGNLWVAVPMAERATASGATTGVATTAGFCGVVDKDGKALTYKGHAISVSVNATIPVKSEPRKPAEPAKPATGHSVPSGMVIQSATMPMANGPMIPGQSIKV